MKKLIGVTIMIMLLLTGCTGGEVEGDNVLTVWYWSPELNGKAMEKAKEIYLKDNPDTQFEFVEMSREDLQTKFTTAALAGDYSVMPDILLLGDDVAPMYLSLYSDVFSNLLNDKVDYNNFPKYKTEPMTLDGTTYGLPFDNSVTGLYCNEKIVNDAGLKQEDFSNLTWSKFEQYGKQIQEKTGKYAYTWDAGTNIEILMHSVGTGYIDENGKVAIEGNEGIKAGLQQMQDMYAEGIVYDSVDWTDYVNEISTGQAACTTAGAWFVPTIKQIEDGAGNWFISEVPKLEGVEGATNTSAQGGSSWYVLNTGDQELASDFLASTFGSSVELYDALLAENGTVATYLPAVDSDSYSNGDSYFGGDTIYSDFMKWSEEVPTFKVGEETAVGKDAIQTYIIDVIKGNITVEEGMSQAQEQADNTSGN